MHADIKVKPSTEGRGKGQAFGVLNTKNLRIEESQEAGARWF